MERRFSNRRYQQNLWKLWTGGFPTADHNRSHRGVGRRLS
nr:MAG TPA: hypothetical protein [Caudoviricetes sp.]